MRTSTSTTGPPSRALRKRAPRSDRNRKIGDDMLKDKLYCSVTYVQNSWVEIFNMMDLAINNLTQQNKELKRTVNELGSKVNKVRVLYFCTFPMLMMTIRVIMIQL
jgi:hypothetical protein